MIANSKYGCTCEYGKYQDFDGPHLRVHPVSTVRDEDAGLEVCIYCGFVAIPRNEKGEFNYRNGIKSGKLNGPAKSKE